MRTVAVVLVATGLAAAPTPAHAQAWQQYANPADAGFSAQQLSDVREYADSARSAAVMAVYRGRVLVAWGDVARKIPLHSVRKSLVSALYGHAIAAGRMRLAATLAELGIDDRQPLSADERTASVRDLISARSGVYLPAA